MAKELPYYKHEPSLWLEGEIQTCSDEAIVCFINLCSGYWIKLGCIGYAFALNKYCRKNQSIMDELINHGVVDKIGDNISIKFLDNQLKNFNNISTKRSESAKKRWDNANALQTESKSNAIREDKIREEEIKKDNIINWRNDFKKYEQDCKEAYELKINDLEWIKEREGYHPNLDVRNTLKKAVFDYWITEAGWIHKKKSKGVKDINWTSTFNTSLTMKSNQVYKPFKPTIEKAVVMPFPKTENFRNK